MPQGHDGDATELLAAFNSVVRANASLVTRLSARAGVHENALRALTLISDTGYSTPSEVSGFLGLTSGAVTNLLDRLTDAGLVTRSPNPADRRGWLLALTPAGDAVVADMQRRFTAVLGTVASSLPEDLGAVLNDLATALLQEAADVDPASGPRD